MEGIQIVAEALTKSAKLGKNNGKILMVKIANAPCSLGIDYADDPNNPNWKDVFKEISNAGYNRKLAHMDIYQKNMSKRLII